MFKECEQCGCKLQCHGTCESDADDVVSALRKALETATTALVLAEHTAGCTLDLPGMIVSPLGVCSFCDVIIASRAALAATKGD